MEVFLRFRCNILMLRNILSNTPPYLGQSSKVIFIASRKHKLPLKIPLLCYILLVTERQKNSKNKTVT